MKKLGIWLKMLYLCITGKGKLVFIKHENNNPTVYSTKDIIRAMDILSSHQEWRIGNSDIATTPKELSTAIRIAINTMCKSINFEKI